MVSNSIHYTCSELSPWWAWAGPTEAGRKPGRAILGIESRRSCSSNSNPLLQLYFSYFIPKSPLKCCQKSCPCQCYMELRSTCFFLSDRRSSFPTPPPPGPVGVLLVDVNRCQLCGVAHSSPKGQWLQRQHCVSVKSGRDKMSDSF